MLFILHNNLTN